jgi:hypothetical protein
VCWCTCCVCTGGGGGRLIKLYLSFSCCTRPESSTRTTSAIWNVPQQNSDFTCTVQLNAGRPRRHSLTCTDKQESA